MLLSLSAFLLLAATTAAQPDPWFEPYDDDSRFSQPGYELRQLSCPFDGRIGQSDISYVYVSPSGIITGEEVDYGSPLRLGDETTYNNLYSWFIAPLFAAYNADVSELLCWKTSETAAITDIVRNSLAADFEPANTLVISWKNMILNDQDVPFDVQAILTSDYNGNAFVVFSYKRDEQNIVSDWKDSVKRVSIKLQNSVVKEYLAAADASSLFGTSNFNDGACCMFALRIGDASSELSKPTVPGTCECSEDDQCTDDGPSMKQRCASSDVATEQPQEPQEPQEPQTPEVSEAETCGALATCNANAACTDLDDGTKCCVCNSDFWGNGAHCYPSSLLDYSLTSGIEVRLWADADWTSLSLSGSTIGLSTLIYKANVDLRFWNFAPLILANVPWLFSNTQDTLQYVPATLTGGNFNRTLQVQMTRGEDSPVSFKLEIATYGDFSANNLNIDLTPEVDGELSVPEFTTLQRLVYKYQHSSQGSITAAGLLVVTDSSETSYKFTWSETLTFFECGRNDHVGVSDRSVQVRLDATSWSDDNLQFSPTIELVDGGIDIVDESTGSTEVREPTETVEQPTECPSECTGNRECRQNSDTAQFECVCLAGYSDNGDQYASCEPVTDACSGQCSADFNTVCGPDSTCVCREGYEAVEGSDPLTCTQIATETCPQACHEKANCTNVDDQWKCVCQGDYVGNETHCELACTVRADVCSRLNERCNPGSRRCECKAGFKLFKDKRGSFCVDSQSCVHAKCRGGMQCVRRDDYNHECICKRDSYFDGSVCTNYAPTVNFSADWLVYAHGVILARGQPDSRGNVVPAPLLVISDQRAVAVTTDCNSGAVYWSDVRNKVIRRAYVNRVRPDPQVVLTLPRSSSVEGMTFDHAAQNLYYTDAGTDSIVVWNVVTNKTKTIVSGVSDPRGITLDLVNNKLYWVDWDVTNPRIERANLDGSGRAIIVSDSATSPVKYPNGIAVDGFKQLLYWADAGTGQVTKMNTNTLGEPMMHFNLENLDRSWLDKRYMIFDISLVRTNEVYATVWGLNGLVRTNDQKTFDRAPGGNGKIFGIDYFRATCPPTSSKCALIQSEDGWKAEQCEKSSQMCFTLAHNDRPNCVCSDDSSDC